MIIIDVIDVTPRIHPTRFSERVPRGREIQSWLNSCQAGCYYSVARFVLSYLKENPELLTTSPIITRKIKELRYSLNEVNGLLKKDSFVEQ